MTIRGWIASSYYARTRNSAWISSMLFLAFAVQAFAAPAPVKRAERLQALENARAGRAQEPAEALWTAWETETDPLVRVRLLQALSRAEGAAVITELSAVLGHEPSVMLRQTAAQELGNLASAARARGALLAALAADSAAEVRYACALSLSLASGAEAVDALDRAARDGDPELRRQAAHALKRHPGAKAKAALKRLEGDSDAGVRGAARR